MTRNFVKLAVSVLALTGYFILLNMRLLGSLSLGPLLEPVNGLYRTATKADNHGSNRLELTMLDDSVQVIRDERGVPHIFATSDRDATIALGFAVAQDRLFQMDFIARVTSGRLAEAMGPGAIQSDRFFRHNGMRRTMEKHAEWLQTKKDLQYQLITWYQAGANAFIDSLAPEDDPFEFRLLGYRPQRLQLSDALSVLLYMNYDLSFSSHDRAYGQMQEVLSAGEYEKLFPRFSKYVVPIVPDDSERDGASRDSYVGDEHNRLLHREEAVSNGSGFDLNTRALFEGFREGKGSNNWAVDGNHSTTGYPILAGDMHLNLSLPSIWYEAHLVTPEMNVYGVTIPGAPVIVEGITEQSAWAFTNTGSDQIDFYDLQLTDDGTGYVVDGVVEPLEIRIDAIQVAGQTPVPDTLYWSRFGPVLMEGERATAVRWVAHDTSRTMLAIWQMGHARTYEEFEEATRLWDSPMQNILYADRSGTIAIRSTGYLPLRGGNDGVREQDGTTREHEWIGRVPFDELPAWRNPQRGYLTSTNQQPASENYPYYLGHDWRSAYRSLRIDSLLSGSAVHSVDDIKSYQADVYAVQADLFLPLLESVDGLSDKARLIRSLLLDWDRNTGIDQIEPVLFDAYLSELQQEAWDESFFQNIRMPSTPRLARLMSEEPQSIWLDRDDTEAREDAQALMRQALEKVADEYTASIEADRQSLLWGEQHKLVIRHITRSEMLRPIWRGPFAYPGYRQTLSPAENRMTTESASWRVVVDFSTEPPSAYGVYPGGQSGNPFSTHYDRHIETYLNFDYYSLFLPEAPGDFEGRDVLHSLALSPASSD